MTPQIIAFGHRSRVGKDSACKFLNTTLKIKGVRTQHISFAGKLKEICHDLYKWAGHRTPIHYENIPVDRNIKLDAIGKTPLELWIETGNKMRDVYPLVWVDYALRSQQPGVQVILISDCRYPNEATRIQELGGRIYKITRSSAPVLNTVADNALEGFTGWDGEYANEGTHEQLNAWLETEILPTVIE